MVVVVVEEEEADDDDEEEEEQQRSNLLNKLIYSIQTHTKSSSVLVVFLIKICAAVFYLI